MIFHFSLDQPVLPRSIGHERRSKRRGHSADRSHHPRL